MRVRHLRLEACEVDLDRRVVRREDGEIGLTWQEAELLAFLAGRPGEPVAREELLREVWERPGRAGPTRAVDIAIRRLREKIERVPARPRHLVTQRSSGYRFEPLAAPPRPPPERVGAVPPERDSFVGRAEDVARVEQALAEDPVVALVGPPGVGKTRLATHLALRWQDEGRAAWLVDVSAAREPADVVRRLSDALRLPADDAGVERLGRALRSRGAAAVVLDGAEQAGDLRAVVDPLLALAPALGVLLTSRTAPDRVRRVELAPLPEDDGARLLLDRARAARAGWGDGDDAVVRRIVAGLDGLPLALELAAARAPVLSPAMLLRGLEDRFRLLSGKATLYGALDWSWSQLSEVERAAAAQLAVFRGGFTVEAAAEVVALSPGAPWVLDWLQPLVARSIVRAEPSPTGDLRFGMLESQRRFALGKLDEAGLRAATEARHRAWCARLAHRLPERIHGPDGDALRPALAAEIDNLRAALDHEETVVACALALDALMELGSPTADRLALLDRAVAAARTPSDAARSRLARGAVRAVRGAADEAQEDVDAALVLAGPDAEPALLARIQDVRAELLVHRQALGPAGDAAREALRLAIAADERVLQALAHLKLGHVASLAGDLATADREFRAMRALAADTRSWRLQARARTNLGALARMEGRLSDAQREYEEALRIAREAGDRVLEATLLDYLGALHASRGATAEALQRLDAALAIHREIGSRRGEVRTLGNRGILLVGAGRLAEGRAGLAAALDLAETGDDPRHLGLLHGNLGVCLAQLDETAGARRHLEDAARLLAPAPFAEAYFSAHLAIARADLDDADAAETALARAAAGLGDGAVVRGLLRVATAHVALSRARTDRSPARIAAARRSLAEAEAEEGTASAPHPGTATQAVLPSELAAALRNLRRREAALPAD